MKKIMPFLIIIPALILQITLLSFITVRGISINVVLILLVILSLRSNEIYGSAAGFAAGGIIDIFFGNVFGVNALAYMSIGFFLGFNSESFYKYDYYTVFILTVIATVFHNITVLVIHYFLRVGNPEIIFVFGRLTLSVFVNSLISYPIFRLFNYISEIMGMEF